MDDTDKVRQFHDDAVANGLDGAAARHQRLGLPLRAGRRDAPPLRPGRGEGHRRGGDREHRRRAQAAGPFQRPVRLLPPRRQAPGQPARDRGAGPRRRLRFASTRTARACSPRRARDRGGRAGRAPGVARTSLFGEAEAPRGGAHVDRRGAALGRAAEAAGGEAALGFYLSGHLFSLYERELRELPAHAARQARARPSRCGWPASWSRRACR